MKVDYRGVDYRLSIGLLVVKRFRLSIAVVAELAVVESSAAMPDHKAGIVREAIICHPVHDYMAYCVLARNRLRTTLKIDRLSQTEDRC